MLDALDSAILTELQRNARQSFRKLARKFEASAVTVAQRVRKMEKHEIIQGYSAMLNHEKLGYGITAVTEVTVSKGKAP
jgi:Lrp/AsnC family transcriptional regulator for asnA, asnC and gidA